MKKALVFYILLAIAIVAVPSVSAYEVVAKQRQEFNSETELKIQNGSSSFNTEVNQEQRQKSDTPKPHKSEKTQDRPAKPSKGTETPKPSSSPKPVSCEASKTRLTAHATEFKNKYQQKENSYKRVYQVVTELITRLEDTDVDTTALQTAATKLQAERSQFLTAADAYLQKVEQVKNLSCDVSTADRKAKFDELRKARQTFDTEQKDVQAVIKDQIKPALAALKNSTSENN